MSTEKVATILDLDSMLDDTLDNIPDMPDFMNPPNGLYSLTCKEVKTEKYTSKPKDGKPAVSGTRIRMTTIVAATKELEAGLIPVPDGTLFSETFQGTEEGLGYFKARAIKMMNVEDVKGVSMRAIFDELTGLNYDAKIVTKISKTDEGDFENLNIRVIPPAA